MKRDGGRLDRKVVIGDNPVRWTSKYGSLVTTVYDIAAADGLNERGLAGHLLSGMQWAAIRSRTRRFNALVGAKLFTIRQHLRRAAL
jgi:penicillin V acylase-like amidase (Ntn superfamily)